ncbi:MAG: hypothetical protein OJF61_001362 [Rhodanobacteraceae bacterium]|nr:MAG: hypothetical protein OJF61_001362 [Rhodanobacteraceae bacterium]
MTRASNHPWCVAPVRPSLAARSKRRAMPLALRKRRFSPIRRRIVHGPTTRKLRR